MTATIDKFGRIVIPKKIRLALGLEPGSTVELVSVENQQSLQIKPVPVISHTISHTNTGWPFVQTTSTVVEDFSIADFITESREERASKFDIIND